MIDPHLVSAVLVTRGNVPDQISQIKATIRAAGIEDIVVWDNSQRANLSCYGRYAGIAEARNEFIFHQDDDLLSPVAELLLEYDPVADRDVIVANNRADEDWRLTAIGCVFHRDLANCFHGYTAEYGDGPEFHRVSDVVFAYKNKYRKVTLGYQDLDNASDVNSSMYLEPGHMVVREEALARC